MRLEATFLRYVHTPPPHNRRLFLDFGAIFSQVTLIFFSNTIRQVIWPSPSTLGTHTISSQNAAERVKERAEAVGPSVATVRQPASWHLVQRNLSGVLFGLLQVPVSTRGFAFAPTFHW